MHELTKLIFFFTLPSIYAAKKEENFIRSCRLQELYHFCSTDKNNNRLFKDYRWWEIWQSAGLKKAIQGSNKARGNRLSLPLSIQRE